jgi:hypothetical protein
MLQEIRARERDMERIQAELDALRSGAAARRGVKRHLPPPVVEEAKRGQPTTTASAREAEDLLEACLGLSEAVLGVSFSHVSSTLVPSRDGRTRSASLQRCRRRRRTCTALMAASNG